MASCIGLLLDAPAEAYVIGDCRYSGSNPTITYKYDSVGASYQIAHGTADSDWDATSAPGSFSQTTGTPNIDVYDLYSTSGSWAWVGGGCGGDGIWFSSNVDLTYNTRTMDGLDSTDKRMIAVHELGHTYGLDHSSYGCTGFGPTVMRSDATWARDNCGVTNAPFTDDVAGVTAIY